MNADPHAHPETSVALVLLAGGRGTRLGGVVKPLLHFQGRPLIAQAIAHLGPQTVGHWIIAPLALHDVLSPYGRLIADPGQGPGRAVWSAAQHIESPWLLIVAADHAHDGGPLFTRLWYLRADHDAVVVQDGSNRETGFMLLRTSTVTRWAAPGPRALKTYLEQIAVRCVDIDQLPPMERRALEDIDTPEDAERWGIRIAPSPKPPG